MVNLIFKIAGSMIPETFEMIKGHPWLMQKNDFKTRLQSCTFYVFKLNIEFIFPAIFWTTRMVSIIIQITICQVS